MIVQFINRQQELEILKDLYNKKKAALVLLYGRRRVGKTRLIQEFLKHRPGIYFYVPNAEIKTILEEFSRTIENEFFKGFKFTDFNAFMEYIAKKAKEGTTIAIDEFQRLANGDSAISLLQKQWDDTLSKTRILLILSGSAMGTIRKIALTGNAPLFGRRTATLHIEPLKFLDLFQWFKKCTAEDLVRIYASFGGTPAYLQHVEEKQTIDTNIISKILNKRSPLYSEPEMLLMEEIRAPQRYMDILTAIAKGKVTISEIADATGLNRENTTTYIKTLEILNIIERTTPITEPEAKKGLYKIKDPFFTFWFRFVRPNKRQLELELEQTLWKNVKQDFNTYLGTTFEEISVQALAEMAKRNLLPLQPDKIGKWWWKQTEIDIVATQKKTQTTLAVEAKWTVLNHKQARSILHALATKTQQIPNTKTQILGIMAKKIQDKEQLRNEGYTALDLQDIEQLTKTTFTKPQESTVNLGPVPSTTPKEMKRLLDKLREEDA